MGWKIPLLSWSQLALPMSCPLVSVLWDEGRERRVGNPCCCVSPVQQEALVGYQQNHLSVVLTPERAAPVSCCEGSLWHTHSRASPLCRGWHSLHSGKGQPVLHWQSGERAAARGWLRMCSSEQSGMVKRMSTKVVLALKIWKQFICNVLCMVCFLNHCSQLVLISDRQEVNTDFHFTVSLYSHFCLSCVLS